MEKDTKIGGEVDTREKIRQRYDDVMRRVNGPTDENGRLLDEGERGAHPDELLFWEESGMLSSADANEVMAAFELMHSPGDFSAIRDVVGMQKSDAVKLALAEYLDATESLNDLVERYHDPKFLDGRVSRMTPRNFWLRVRSKREALLSMVENSSGEAQVVFRQKLEAFDAALSKFASEGRLPQEHSDEMEDLLDSPDRQRGTHSEW